jgi:hypothetical protein
MLPNREGGRDGGSLMTNSAGSVTTQSIAFKYTMASEPYMNAWEVCHTVRLTFFQNAFSIEINMFLNFTEIFLNSEQNFRKVCKQLDFRENNI